MSGASDEFGCGSSAAADEAGACRSVVSLYTINHHGPLAWSMRDAVRIRLKMHLYTIVSLTIT